MLENYQVILSVMCQRWSLTRGDGAVEPAHDCNKEPDRVVARLSVGVASRLGRGRSYSRTYARNAHAALRSGVAIAFLAIAHRLRRRTRNHRTAPAERRGTHSRTLFPNAAKSGRRSIVKPEICETESLFDRV